ncbi:hypothetical protein KFE80_06125 [bacterium SCSIO 12696]|nr:hypothetical protein KFE80_06125 [bacterium SCSIO 12696]
MPTKILSVKAFIVALSLILSSTCLAESVDVSDVEIVEVYINSTGRMLMKIEGLPEWLEIGHAGNPPADALYSTALAAKLAKQKIWIRYWTQGDDFSTVGIISVR